MKSIKKLNSRKQSWLFFALAFAIIGVGLLIITKAATPSYSIEPESGQTNGVASQISDTTASGGKAIKFGDIVTGGTTVFIAAAGDIGTSGSTDTAVANRIKADTSIAGVLALGDLAYPNGTQEEFRYYNDTWGAFKSKTYPAPGNHEYFSDIINYKNYWSNAVAEWANTPKPPAAVSVNPLYYSFNLGSWHLISLDSEKTDHTSSSAQVNWLKTDLAANKTSCTIAFWHSPYWAGSGSGVSNSHTKPFMDALYAAKADIVLAGHEHAYNRFPKMNPNSATDANGIRTWVSGMGGTGPATSGDKSPLNEVYLDGANGVSGAYLKLELKPTSYTWQYIDTNGTIRDSGSDTCI